MANNRVYHPLKSNKHIKLNYIVIIVILKDKYGTNIKASAIIIAVWTEWNDYLMQ